MSCTYALLFHDAGFLDDHIALGFDTKEAYSAHLAATQLREHGLGAKTVEKVVDAILCTHIDAKFVTTEQKAVRAADLSGLAADYETFVGNTANLKDEHEYLHGETFDWPVLGPARAGTIEKYLAQEIRLTSYFSDAKGESAFHRAVRATWTASSPKRRASSRQIASLDAEHDHVVACGDDLRAHRLARGHVGIRPDVHAVPDVLAIDDDTVDGGGNAL